MMLYSRELSVGNRTIDSEHKDLFIAINWLSGIIKAGEVNVLSPAFDLLDIQLRHYFEVEEHIARAASFDFTQHKQAHQRLLNKIHSIRDELTAKNGMLFKSEEKSRVDSLADCLARHIREDGKPLKIVLDTHFYDFKPD